MSNEGPVSSNSARETIELRLEFAGTPLIVRTRDPQIAEHLRESYTFMIASDGTAHGGGQGGNVDGAAVLDLIADLPIGLELVQFIHNEISRRFIEARPDLLWIHAGAVERDGGALIIAGASGQGKSTLTTAMCEEGWKYLSDDVAPIDMVVDIVLPYPQIPRRRVYSELYLTLDEVQTLERKVVPIARESVQFEPVPVAGFLFLDFRLGASANIEKLSAGEFALELVGNARNFLDHRNDAVARAAAIARRVPGYRLIYDDSAAAVGSIKSVFSAVRGPNID